MNVLKLFRLIAVFVLLFAAVTPVVSSNILERSEADLQELRRESRVAYNASADEIKKHQKDDLAHPYYAMLDWLLWKTKTSYEETEVQKFTQLTNFLLNHGGHWGWSKAASMTDAELAQFKHLASRYYSVNDEASVKESLPHASTLKNCKEAVQIHTLSDNLIYTYNPEIERWVVMEKLTADRSQKWGEYAFSQDAFRNIGVGSFLQSVTRRFQDSSYHDKTNDMWVAYMSNKQPTEASLVRDIQARNIEMVTSVRAKKELNLYSPMGIFRTQEGKVVQEAAHKKPRIPHSVYFHAEIARLVKKGYGKVKYFWTRPLKNMSNILMTALHPEFNLHKKVVTIHGVDYMTLCGADSIPGDKLRIVKAIDDIDEASWKDDTDFNMSEDAIIKIEDLIRAIL